MRIRTVLLLFLLGFGLTADNLEKTQKKALETQVKTMTGEAQKLEKLGQLAEARAKYAASQALIEMKEVTDALKRVDDEIHKRVKDALNQSRKLYEARKFNEAASALDESMKLQTFQAVLSYNLALCYYQLGDRAKALEYLAKAKPGTVDPKQKEKLQQLLTHVTTGENGFAMNDNEKDRIVRINQLADSIGLDASLEDDSGSEEPFFEGDAATADSTAVKPANPVLPKTDRPVTARSDSRAGHRSSLCNALAELKSALAKSPSATFNLANCAESNGRTAEASTLLERYLEMAPKALDAEESRARIDELKSLLSLPGRNGVEIRRLYASAYSALSERQFDRAFTAFTAAAALAPDFAPTKWKLALLYEATGNVDPARQNFLRYQQLASDQSAKDEAALHLSTLDAKRAKYDEEVDAAGDIVADLFNRSLKLAFNGSETRSALRAKRAQVKKKNDQAKARNRVGGFAIPFAYAQQQLGEASGHLQVALALFPLGAEANQLMGLVFLQANDGRSAIKSFDAVASQGLPVAFYAEMRGRKQDRAVKVELNRNGLRLIYLSSYDKKGNMVPPGEPAGEDGLGDMVIDPSAPRTQEFESLNLTLSQIKKVETDKGVIKVKLADQEITLSPIYVPTFTPLEGPQARRFANSYTRLFVRYPGLEDSKLGTEGMSGGEKFKMGYNIASASLDMATSGFSVIGAISSVQDAISIARTIRAAVVSLSLSFATWEKSVNDQQQLLAGKAFKSIPTQPVNLAFVQEIK
jgi:tetratricopeptide (TPR) repeat protein